MRVDPGGGNGFTVDAVQLNEVARQLGRAYDDMNTALANYGGASCYDASAFGDFGMRDAWSGFDSNWAGELSTISQAIDELSTKVVATTNNYTSTEGGVTDVFHGIHLR